MRVFGGTNPAFLICKCDDWKHTRLMSGICNLAEKAGGFIKAFKRKEKPCVSFCR